MQQWTIVLTVLSDDQREVEHMTQELEDIVLAGELQLVAAMCVES